MKKAMMVGFLISISVKVFAASPENFGLLQLDLVKVKSYRTVDHSTLVSIRPQLLQAFQAAQLPLSEIVLSESYESAYHRTNDQVTLAEDQANARDVTYYKNNQRRLAQQLSQDQHKIVIYYRPTYSPPSPTLKEEVMNLFGVEESIQEKERKLQLLAQEPKHKLAQAVGKALIETVNATSGGQTSVTEKDLQLVPSNMASNEIIIAVGSGLINTLK